MIVRISIREFCETTMRGSPCEAPDSSCSMGLKFSKLPHMTGGSGFNWALVEAFWWRILLRLTKESMVIGVTHIPIQCGSSQCGLGFSA